MGNRCFAATCAWPTLPSWLSRHILQRFPGRMAMKPLPRSFCRIWSPMTCLWMQRTASPAIMPAPARGCRIRLITVRSQLGDGKFLSREGTRYRDLLVARMSLPHDMDAAIRIDSQRDRLPERLNEFHIDHDQFDCIFGVVCSDKMTAARLLTPDFAETMLLYSAVPRQLSWRQTIRPDPCCRADRQGQSAACDRATGARSGYRYA